MGWKLIGRMTGIALFLGAFVAANAAPIGPPPSAMHVASVPADPAIAAQAQLAAQEHFQDFLAQIDDADHANAAVRVDLATDDGTVATWVRPISPIRGGFRAELTEAVGPLPAGAALPIASEQVRDWHYFDQQGRMYGAFTARIRLADLGPGDAAAIRRILSSEPVPTRWN